MRHKDLAGQNFGRLTVRRRGANTGGGTARWECVCACGNTTLVRGDSLRSGKTTSCGCHQRAVASERTTHGLVNHWLYRRHVAMRERCGSAGYEHVTVCQEWDGPAGFMVFFEWSMANGAARHLTIDRINGQLGYSPANCRWAGWDVQSLNKRGTVMHEGAPAKLHADAIGVGREMYRRRARGWSPDAAATTPKRQLRKHIAPDGRHWKHIAAEHGVSQSLFAQRLRAGRAVEEAATTAPLPRGPKRDH